MGERSMHIGEVADHIGLSVRTIRYYEEVGLITPSARTAGGFRLYTEADTSRLQIVKDMKPLGFSLEEMGNLIGFGLAFGAAVLSGVFVERPALGFKDAVWVTRGQRSAPAHRSA